MYDDMFRFKQFGFTIVSGFTMKIIGRFRTQRRCLISWWVLSAMLRFFFQGSLYPSVTNTLPGAMSA